ncbi:glycosyltransferase [Hymenobacter koreensis]|uniref:Glycosyltransferase n=1 Tax=Hymenobacter koreensis TaxID=1084523 RepID=A0ABP8IYV0_9BACT
MNVLLSAYGCNPRQGGENGNGFHWAWQTAVRGHRVWCLTTTDGRAGIEEYLLEHAAEPAATRLQMVYVDVPAWVEFLFRWQFGVYFNYMVWQYQAWRKAKELDQTVDFNLVHHATFGSLQFASWLWRLKKPFIFGPVGGGQQAPVAFKRYLPGWFKTETMRNAISWLLLTFDPNVRQTVRHASVVLAGNRETARLAESLGAQRVELFLDTGLPETFFPEQVSVRAPHPELRLLWLARLYPRKALPMVLEALAQVHPRVRFHLTIIGDGPLGPLVPSWLAQYGLQERATWHGAVSWAEAREALAAHDVFLFGSLRDSFASQFLEAMAMGLPIITLNHQGARDFIPAEAAIKVPVTTPTETTAALARAVERLYDHPELLPAMGAAGFAFARTQAWPARAARMAQLEEQLVGLASPQNQPLAPAARTQTEPVPAA